jgi:hypothetical protein
MSKNVKKLLIEVIDFSKNFLSKKTNAVVKKFYNAGWWRVSVLIQTFIHTLCNTGALKIRINQRYSSLSHGNKKPHR